MAPKRKRADDEGVHDTEKTSSKPPTLMFGLSTLKQHDIQLLESSGMTEPGKARVAEENNTKPSPKSSEVVVFRDHFVSGLRFPLDPVVVDILKHCGVYLHQLTPNAFVRLNIYMWVCKSTKIKASVEGFLYAHKVHKLSKAQLHTHPSKGDVEKECQFACLNFTYKPHVLFPVMAYLNKWPNKWWTAWMYHEADKDDEGNYPIVCSPLVNLPKSWPSSTGAAPEGVAFVEMLQKIS